jgi:hypothetical protein
VAKGIVINGLPIMLKLGSGPGSFFDIENLDEYYGQCVIGGTAAFEIPIRTRDEISSAVRRKLLLEISGSAHTPRLVPLQLSLSPPQPVDCLIGEKLWQRYMEGAPFLR